MTTDKYYFDFPTLGPEVTEQMNDQDLQRSRVQDESDTNMDALFESMSDEEHAPSRNDEEQPMSKSTLHRANLEG